MNYLCTRTNKYTNSDINKLQRILKYLKLTTDYELTFKKSNQYNLNIFVDASYNTHHDCKGHSGLVIQLNNNTIYTNSSKQKLTASSSTESELIEVQ